MTEDEREDLYFEVHNAIIVLTMKRGYAPSVKEVALYMGWASTSTAHRWLKMMKAAGWITYEKDQPRTLRCL